MSDLTKLENNWDSSTRECRIVIETPKGSRNKYAYDPKTGLFELHGLLAEGLSFPFDFGFVPLTIGGDGDPLDIMVLMDEPTHVGCLVGVRLIGVVQAEQTQKGETEENDRLIGVAVHSHQHGHLKSISEVNPSILDQVDDFFVTYNRNRGTKFNVKGRHGPKRAADVLELSMKQLKRQSSSK